MKNLTKILVFVYVAIMMIAVACKKDDPTPTPVTPVTPTTTPPVVTKSTAKDITKFSFAALSPVVEATIDATTKAITATVPATTDITKLVPTITISDKATVSPASGVATDFSKEVSYTVTAEDASTVVWKVNVKKEDIVKSPAKDIIKFSFPTLSPVIDATIDVTTKAINATVPIGTDLTKLVPTISISDKATISPAKGVAQDFSKEVSYTVTAEDASTVVYKVNLKSSFPTNDLVAFFPFNGSAKDESGKGIDGKLNGAVLAKDRKGNQNCYSFDGKSNITFDKIPSIGIDNWAISFWTNNTIDKQLAMFISLGNEDGANASGFSIGYGDGLDNTGYRLQGVFGGVALVPWNISGQNDAGAWRHFVMQRQNGVTKFYFAGKLLFTSNVLSNPKPPTSFTIGSGSSGSKLPRNYNGLLDDIRIYNRALNDQEIMALSLE